MLLTPRTYSLAQTDTRPGASYLLLTPSQREIQAEEQRARKMLLLHQTGSVKVGEVVRYTVTYTPSEDRILPAPAFLHVRIRNTSALPLRAAYLHGPYTIHVAAYSDTFHPNKKVESPKAYGIPEFEPNLKAGGYWNARLTVPEHIRQGDEWRNFDGTPKSATWIIEVDSQIIFSNSASVSYELLVARDERSLDLGFTAVTGNSSGTPGKVQDHQQGKRSHVSHHPAQPKGVFSKAIKLVVDDTTSLWNKPELLEYKEEEDSDRRTSKDVQTEPKEDSRKQRHVHLVMVTHGLHSNLGADMLYLKESIDATAKQAREDRRRRRQEQKGQKSKSRATDNAATAPLSGGQEDIQDEEEDEDEEDIVVRGFDGNVVRTERGIQYLGKRLAKHVLRLTYPDQPYLPIKKSVGQKLNPFSPVKDKPDEGQPIHEGSGVHFKPHVHKRKRAYKFTSISFIGHSLGGLIQTYAIAYIHKHSPHFFEHIKPINFVAMASPMLGLSNENPMYVKFALDFGLVGRTGQDLGLTWRAPTLAKSGWTAMVSGFGGQSQHQEQADPGTKPLLRILPTGPAHLVLRMFRNRTVYSNVVNDGVVPLRTSCLLFLDWRGLGKVEKARRENGLIGSMAVWGFSQLTGQNSSPNPSRIGFQNDNDDTDSPSGNGDDTTVPLPGADVTNEDDRVTASEPAAHQFLDGRKHDADETVHGNPGVPVSDQYFQPQNTLMQWWSYIRPTGKHTSRDKKMFTRSQTIHKDDEQQEGSAGGASTQDSQPNKRPIASRGDSTLDPSRNSAAPPKTTIFESAGDIINPPVPPMSWIIDPSTRARTIFHDRVYHPEDIPPPPVKKRSTSRTFSGDSSISQTSTSTSDQGIRVEEKIARAYHKDLSWRKVLVRLEPDAHNNIVVRRMFANAYGWPVIKHLCDTHFADTYSAQTRDEQEPALDRAKAIDVPVTDDGEHVKGQEDFQPPIERTESELREVRDELAPLTGSFRSPKRMDTTDSIRSTSSSDWDNYFEGCTSDEDDDNDERNAVQKFLQLGYPRGPKTPTSPNPPRTPTSVGTSDAEISDFLKSAPAAAQPVPFLDIHRGLGASPRQSSKVAKEPDSQQPLTGKAVLPPGHQVATSPPASPSLHLSDVGLRQSMESSPKANRARSGSGVSEQVARSMSTVKDRERP